MADNCSDDLATLAALLVLGIPIALALALISAGIERSQQLALQKEAQAIFSRVREETTPELHIDPLLRTIFGENLDLSDPAITGTSRGWTDVIFGSDLG